MAAADNASSHYDDIGHLHVPLYRADGEINGNRSALYRLICNDMLTAYIENNSFYILLVSRA